MQITIETTKITYTIGNETISKFVVSPLKGFKDFINLGHEAADKAKNDEESPRVLFRERLKRQVKAYNGTDNAIALSDDIISKIPIPYAVRLKAALGQATEEMEGKPEILQKGDGIVEPIRMKLGKPLKFQDGRAITELEFQAKVFADIENAICADSKGDQAVALLTMATPIGEGLHLTALPSWAADAISMEDGMFILQEVAPSFLGVAPEES